ncbi:hypothetical protein ASPWEDRAFT_39128 [Aspergillus wentii DTO 134E9]|uniref:Uncharacterized protein n=1 Tax=Aspergillus wentii DTO 134E9 TaxID=1073089 RepID=A0A1L9RR98_ASPWE|nr:uncharacterized protein ASPWEDRAFT_39128 [Aspergillus wentii DTO 134E9]KAI9930295.1 hypothetical protein MW887_011046 [Aspergillus wentii]OJJ37444.1 hypothetical protein ASPWEDRAFT_39128 [Aspergillus wentii DTO 134E9]
MRDMPSKFIEILDPEDGHLHMSSSDVRLEDVLADHEATVTRPRSSTQTSSKTSGSLDKERLDRRDSVSPPQSPWKRWSSILTARRP